MLLRQAKPSRLGGWPPRAIRPRPRLHPARVLAHRRAPVKPRGPLGALGLLDQQLLRQLRTRGHWPPVEEAMKGLGMVGEWAAVWVAVGLGSAAFDQPRRRRWLASAAVGPASVVANFAVKLAVGRDRPLIDEHPALARAPSKLSFPSAHATSSVAAAVAMGRIEPAARPPLYGLAGAICLCRPYLGMHYPSDVVAGIALGALLGRLAPGVGEPTVEERLIDLVAGRDPAAESAEPAGSAGPAEPGVQLPPGAALEAPEAT